MYKMREKGGGGIRTEDKKKEWNVKKIWAKEAEKVGKLEGKGKKISIR